MIQMTVPRGTDILFHLLRIPRIEVEESSSHVPEEHDGCECEIENGNIASHSSFITDEQSVHDTEQEKEQCTPFDKELIIPATNPNQRQDGYQNNGVAVRSSVFEALAEEEKCGDNHQMHEEQMTRKTRGCIRQFAANLRQLVPQERDG